MERFMLWRNIIMNFMWGEILKLPEECLVEIILLNGMEENGTPLALRAISTALSAPSPSTMVLSTSVAGLPT
ncbi:MAG: hypothetical protein US91_C0008G0095 [Candidatus Falkowbacteria bacterium GW2011_GWE1_38_31]|uniref:Uncharacterized protein n=1 Tax=Candidatus Falkowbacteria bacterium GW2011_GWE1_38_31 TaxID=1618638 RepID=A0A0G0K3B9_9BACT|nr:MAG: hypothetical protein US87_C0008G0094 [Candidatus Falkowbacteria bacterium GW2011_GWE2_38_254]KKQ69975.1 MAG: hypothetical protein US91_C0008G0095 [Candidatus Falkowbacteria bacterium GW2011_GWE1_38_31]